MKAATKKMLSLGKKSRFPGPLSPMLCTLTREPVTSDEYIHEIKFDGYRIIGYRQNAKVRLASRSGLDYTSKYPNVEQAFKKLPLNCVIDGEVCALNAAGLPDFDTLQKPPAGTQLVFYAFDLLWLDGFSLLDLPLTDRKSILADFLSGNMVIRYSEHYPDAIALFEKMKSLGVEGIVSKKKDSTYVAGQRGGSWYKTPTEMRQEYVIGGWVESGKGRAFASLLFGAYKNKKLEWVGHAGGGFKHKDTPGILVKMKRLEIKKSPFSNKVDYKGIVHWVKPTLVANFKFATFTKSGRIRKPAIFLGFREDKPANKVVQEKVNIAPKKKNQNVKASAALPKASPGSNWHMVEKLEPVHSETMMIGECSFTAYDIEREIWKGVSKMQLIQYYHEVCPFIMPHIKDRPQSLHVKPVNATAPGMYIKDMEGRQPECAEIFSDQRKHKKAGKRDIIDYLVCSNEATLLYMVNLGCIDINPWTSRVTSTTEPDYIIIDLDPSDNDFKKAITAAEATKQILDEAALRAFVKTSGKTGIHIYLPCRGFSFPSARSIAENICSQIQKLLPKITTTTVSVSARGTKLYLDPNQNDYADTVAAPYAARPHHIPTVSTPLEWKEVNVKLDPLAFTVSTILKRIEKKGDLFAGVLEEKIALKNTTKLAGYL
jgi:bifunctional non-homologous end joining protein LigD